jgi:hypothetical protein
MEEWYFDTSTMAIEKKVVGACPLGFFYDSNNKFIAYKSFFWVYFSAVWLPFDGKLDLEMKK